MTAAAAAPAAPASSPCAGCKFLRRKCQPDCVFAPYFPPDEPQKFACVHKVFGASNVAKLLNELRPCQREDAVSSLAYEAEMRLRDPVYGCVGVISVLQHQLRQLQAELSRAKTELSRCQAQAQAAAAIASAAADGCDRDQFVLLRGCDGGEQMGVSGEMGLMHACTWEGWV